MIQMCETRLTLTQRLPSCKPAQPVVTQPVVLVLLVLRWPPPICSNKCLALIGNPLRTENPCRHPATRWPQSNITMFEDPWCWWSNPEECCWSISGDGLFTGLLDVHAAFITAVTSPDTWQCSQILFNICVNRIVCPHQCDGDYSELVQLGITFPSTWISPVFLCSLIHYLHSDRFLK